MIPQFKHQWKCYGNWSFAVKDYQAESIFDFMDTKMMEDLSHIVDPYYYLTRPRLINVPKFLICATGDEFFMPDSPQFFYDKIQGVKHLWMVPNAEHSLAFNIINVAFPYLFY